MRTAKVAASMRQIVAAQRRALDARIDRQLKQRTDALGALFARAKAARKTEQLAEVAA